MFINLYFDILFSYLSSFSQSDFFLMWVLTVWIGEHTLYGYMVQVEEDLHLLLKTNNGTSIFTGHKQSLFLPMFLMYNLTAHTVEYLHFVNFFGGRNSILYHSSKIPYQIILEAILPFNIL